MHDLSDCAIWQHFKALLLCQMHFSLLIVEWSYNFLISRQKTCITSPLARIHKSAKGTSEYIGFNMSAYILCYRTMVKSIPLVDLTSNF